MKEYNFENRIYYRTNEFKPERLTLVFVHGVSGSSSAWWPYEKIFEKKYNVLTYDIRGHGMSKKYPNYTDYEVKNFVEDLHKLVSSLGISKFVLISNSFGGLVHLEYIKLYRENVVANIFTSPEVYEKEESSVKIIRFASKILTGIISLLPFNPKPRGHVDYKRYVGSTDWSVGRNIADIRNTGLHAHFYTLRQSFTPGLKYGLENIDIPTLIIHGEKDSMVPIKNSIFMSKRIKNSKFVRIPGIDHNTAHNAVKEMSSAIESFLEKHKAELRFS